MKRQAFADIETIHVRVEERRLGSKGPGNWRVHEFTGFDAIPPELEAAFGNRTQAGAHVLSIQTHLSDLYRRRKECCRIEDSYEVQQAGASRSVAKVERTLTMEVRYRRRQAPLAKAA